MTASSLPAFGRMALPGGPLPLTVSPGRGDLPRIQDAIDAAGDGGTIVVRAGVYRENLTVRQTPTILGEEGVFLEPADPKRPAMILDEAKDVAIHGPAVRMATVGIAVWRGSCTISNCSIRASESCIRIVTFDADTVRILHCVLCGDRGGVGVSLVGSGSAMVARCDLASLATAILVGVTGMNLVQNCTVESCFREILLSMTVHTDLLRNTIRGNCADGIRADPVAFPADEGTVFIGGNTIHNNARWGLMLCGMDGSGVGASFGRIDGYGNDLSGNGRGRVCPKDLPLPEGLIAE